MTAIPYMAAAAALAGLGLAFFFFGVVKKADPGSPRMVQLMEAIQEGARAFLRREYKAIAVFVVVLAVLIALLLDNGVLSALAYLVGAVFSALAGFIGMTVATMANARTAEAAKSGPQLALPLAFRGGAVMGFAVAGLSLLGVAAAYIVFNDVLSIENPIQVVTTYSLGASSIALFARIGGGIYTKAADVGADLVGKVEAGIPEDDPRNPATIADNVGDNVGDVAGMGADLFESYAGSLIAPIALAGFAFAQGVPEGFQQAALLYPLAIAAFGMLAAIIGAFTVKTG
ncbi:MAG: sodium-translocating pyrophosphatase, partial [Nitriliruptorales bacterium]|nr:sodium-translocating pyrophosphatase [Nitriliruptorales bacterium]